METRPRLLEAPLETRLSLRASRLLWEIDVSGLHHRQVLNGQRSLSIQHAIWELMSSLNTEESWVTIWRLPGGITQMVTKRRLQADQ